MSKNHNITCRLLAASATTYWIERAGGITACPYYQHTGYANEPTILTGGIDKVDAITVGSTTDDCVIVACRGTLISATDHDQKQEILDWINNLRFKPVHVPGLPPNCRAHEGFFKAANYVESPAGKNVFDETVAQLKAIGRHAKLYMTGHSKGGAMSYIVAAQFIAAGYIPNNITTFAAARPGDIDFAHYVETRMAHREIYRYEAGNDIVPHLPPDLKVLDLLQEVFGHNNLSNWDYESVGQLHYYDTDGKLTVASNKLARILANFQRLVSLGEVIVKGEFSKIVDDHDLTKNYAPLICPDLPDGDVRIDAKDP